MCDIWKGNKNARQLSQADIGGLLDTLKRFRTRQVVMSGGEALLNPAFFSFCDMLRKLRIKITLLSAGLTLERHARELTEKTDDLIISLDGDAALHDQIRNIPGAFEKIQKGIGALRSLRPGYKITGRTVIQRNNFREWAAIIAAARVLPLDQISFLPADVSSHAFNRETPWSSSRQKEILLSGEELPLLRSVVDSVLADDANLFDSGFIAESPEKIKDIYHYYAAWHGLSDFPYKKCNAPWVSAVIEADGTVRPCFFHESLGNIKEQRLDDILNSAKAVGFRKSLDVGTDPVCTRCVCHLNLHPLTRL
jgi:MoaA/NifB/PqqE/SkfB family radical SAM enzyme